MRSQGRAGGWATVLVAGFALAVLLVCLVSVGFVLTAVFGWWSPATAVILAVGVVVLAIRTYPQGSRSRVR